MTKRPDPATAGKPLPYRELTGSQYRAIANKIKQWNPCLWDEWAELWGKSQSWSAQEAAASESEFKAQNKKFRHQVMRFLLEQNIANNRIEVLFWLNYLHFCCLEDHGLERLLPSIKLPPG